MAENINIIGTLTLLVVLGLGLRVTQLGAIGFAEDEMNKLDAVLNHKGTKAQSH